MLSPCPFAAHLARAAGYGAVAPDATKRGCDGACLAGG
ncbi:MAG: hypothetical protein AVDCRST_MAG15-467 [uncultured Rubellimicrobium sp.]|uniref:Uncharacterized protein n=1 Tax=uncultured Rubellimicrobium sp. TaxID=543078 RepID=A0A6J4NL10_9RHOB|nr:MAG: hypothetical protein AVDCRST_MAG15-467 [uncultured Rubellimicrobium sp.]